MLAVSNTSKLVETASYYPTPELFFANFSGAWNVVQSQVLKLETRQTYKEPGNPSYEALIAGDFAMALKLLPATKEADHPIYDQIAKRHVEFLRCRPVIYPFSQYLKWEMAVYDLNSQLGERIFCYPRSGNIDLFSLYAHHDFMVFDQAIAFVHDYDEDGLIRGGWVLHDLVKIESLTAIFSLIKASCKPYYTFKEDVV